MKPEEFWNSTYREINIFTQVRLTKIMDELRQEIQVQEEVTNKLIMADAMSNRRPKIISLLTIFQKIFPKKENESQSNEEITRRMRLMMKEEKR
ncbi:MAG: hypothetical protein HFJ44_04675 [Clostridia bacterium]|jgi:hypothetical protein|nr:hypothetical protein [Clostridia bacterium]